MKTSEFHKIIGIDEAGRGPIAGSVYASCVLLPENFDCSILNDSKKLSEKQREAARQEIMKQSIFSTACATCEEIDRLNILQATFLAMQRAFESFLKKAEGRKVDVSNSKIIIDGNKLPPFFEKYKEDLFSNGGSLRLFPSCMIKADSKIPAVMAASIMAKTERDRYMLEQDRLWPQYGYAKHKGYCTKSHMAAIRKFGTSPIQRMTFKMPGIILQPKPETKHDQTDLSEP